MSAAEGLIVRCLTSLVLHWCCLCHLETSGNRTAFQHSTLHSCTRSPPSVMLP